MQLPLGISLDDQARFDNFRCSPADRPVLSTLSATLSSASTAESFIYLFGPPGCGRSHLLQALCYGVNLAGGGALYLPMKERHQFSPDIFDGVHHLSLVAIDDLPLLAGDVDWELALFAAFNRMQEVNSSKPNSRESVSRLVVSADMPPRRLPVEMPDLQSRLNSGLVLQLHALGDEDKLAMLRLRAGQRGMDLPAEVADYILHRAPRDTHALMRLLNRLDRASMTRQRKLSVPLVRAVLAEG